VENGTVQVFTYRVDRRNSEFLVEGTKTLQVIVGFCGRILLDSTTHSIGRIRLIAEDLLQNSPVHHTGMAVDYDYASINNHDYLVPMRARPRVRQGVKQAVLNNIEFRNYRRFGSSMKIPDANPEPEKQQRGGSPGDS